MATIADKINTIRGQMSKAKMRAHQMVEKAEAEGRDFTDDETAICTGLITEYKTLKANRDNLLEIAAEDAMTDQLMRSTPVPSNAGDPAKRTASLRIGRDSSSQMPTRTDGPTFVYRGGNASGKNAAVARGESFGSHDLVKEYAASRADADRRMMDANGGDFGQMLRSMTTTSVSALVPTAWSNNIIDLARNDTVCFEAGATLVPMPDKVVKIGRLTTDASPAFKAESAAITAADLAFDNVTLTATSLSALAVASIEFVQDAPNAGSAIMESLAKSMALQLDLVALFGQLAAGNEPQAGNLASPNPMGLLTALLAYNSGSNVLGAATNGTTQTSTTMYNELINTLYKPMRGNEHPTALISNVALKQIYDLAYDTQGRPLVAPQVLSNVDWLTTNAIPSFTAGTMTSVATDVFAGDFREMLIGQRMGLDIRVLSERYAELGQVGFRAYWRGDCQIARPGAFACYRYLRAAA